MVVNWLENIETAQRYKFEIIDTDGIFAIVIVASIVHEIIYMFGMA